jgi:hypothetical protein
MLSVVCWKWKPPIANYRSTFTGDTVNTLRRMVARHYPDPHRFICVTDDATGIGPDVDVVPIWNDHGDLPHPHSHTHPSCYRRLKAFAPEMRELFGPRFVSVDLDCVILEDLRPLWNRPEPFVGWGGTTAPREAYNGSMYLMSAGCRAKVWRDFHPQVSPVLAKQAGFYGSDQAWMSYALGPQEPRWTTADGVYSFRIHIAPNHGQLPGNARIVFFNGKKDPWTPDVYSLPWVRANWR